MFFSAEIAYCNTQSSYVYADNKPVLFKDINGEGTVEQDWIPVEELKGVWKAEKDDNIETLAKDANISLGEAAKVMDKHNLNYYDVKEGTYVDTGKDDEKVDEKEAETNKVSNTTESNTTNKEKDLAYLDSMQNFHNELGLLSDLLFSEIETDIGYAQEFIKDEDTEAFLTKIVIDEMWQDKKGFFMRSGASRTRKVATTRTTVRVSGQIKKIYTVPRCGKYYINKNGTRTYLNRDGTKRKR